VSGRNWLGGWDIPGQISRRQSEVPRVVTICSEG